MSIRKVMVSIQCDEPGCEERFVVHLNSNLTIMSALRLEGWQPYGQFDYCPEHRKDQ